MGEAWGSQSFIPHTFVILLIWNALFLLFLESNVKSMILNSSTMPIFIVLIICITRLFIRLIINSRRSWKTNIIPIYCSTSYFSNGVQNILTILKTKKGNQHIPNITTTAVIILIDFFFFAVKFWSLSSLWFPGIWLKREEKYTL